MCEFTTILVSVLTSSPNKASKKELLPEPTSPITQTNSPFSIFKFIFLRIGWLWM